MDKNKFQQILRLVKTANQKVVVFDSDLEQGFVILPLEEYGQNNDNYVDNQRNNLTDDVLVDKINKDIAFWKNQEEQIPYINPQPEENENSLEEEYYLEPLEEDE